MPILQENFPFVQKSSRTLVRYNHLIHKYVADLPENVSDVRKLDEEALVSYMIRLWNQIEHHAQFGSR